MRNEIGSEFWDVPTSSVKNCLFSDNVNWYISGRVAFRAILKDLKPKKVALPSYCCETIIQPLIVENIKYSFYNVELLEEETIVNNVDDDCDAILIMDYFGFRRSNKCFSGKTVIRDLTHSVFCGDYSDADYYFGSLRKWAGFYTGGFALKKDGILKNNYKQSVDYNNLRKSAMKEKKQYIKGLKKEKSYLELFKNAERFLSNCDMYGADLNDVERFSYLNVAQLKKKRINNASILIKELGDLCIYKNINKDDCPLFVPIKVKNKRDDCRNKLIENNVFCPIHWPKFSEMLNDSIYKEELSLVCDQRYNENDMKRIIKIIKEI